MAEAVKGLNVSLGLDATEFDSKLKDISASLRKQSNEMKQINNLLRYDKNNVDLWRKKQDALNNTLNLTRQRIELNNKKLAELKKTSSGVSDAEFKNIENAIKKDTAEAEKLELQLKQVKEQVNKLGTLSAQDFSKFGSNMTRYVTAPIIAAGTALTAFTIQSANTADELYDASSKVYLSVEAYQEWSYASKILAVDQDKLFKAFVKVNAVLGDIASGNVSKQVSDSFNLIGLSIEELKGLDTDQAFSLIRDRLSEVEDMASRAAVANAIFGDKLGSELTQVFGASAEEVKALKEEMHSLGIVTNEQAEMAGTFNDELDKLKLSLQGVGYELMQESLPLMKDVLEFVKDDVVPALEDLIHFIGDLPKPVKEGAAGFLIFAAALGPVIQFGSQAVITFQAINDYLPKISLALKNLNKQTLITAAGIGALTGAAGLVIDTIANWDELNTGQVILRGLATAALAAAGAMAVFHASWSVGLAVGGIVAGITAAAAVIKGVQESMGVEGDATSQMNSAAVNAGTLANQVASSTVTNNNNSSVDNSTNYYNIEISAEDYASAEEVANQLALKLQSRA